MVNSARISANPNKIFKKKIKDIEGRALLKIIHKHFPKMSNISRFKRSMSIKEFDFLVKNISEKKTTLLLIDTKYLRKK